LLVLTKAFFVNNEIITAFLLNPQAQGVSGKDEQSTQTPWRGAQCSCIGLRPALTVGCLPSSTYSHEVARISEVGIPYFRDWKPGRFKTTSLIRQMWFLSCLEYV